MPDLLEKPTTPPPGLAPFCFTRETASLAGKRSGQARRQRAALEPINLPLRLPVDRVERAVNAQLNLVAEQITRTRAVLNDDKHAWCDKCERGGIEPHHRAQLLKALDALLDRQRKLLGIPDPGVCKPRSNDRTPANPGAYRVYDDSPPVPAKPVVPEVAKVEPETPRPQFPDGGCP